MTKATDQTTDGIATAFEMIMDEIQKEADKIAERGAGAFKAKNYAEAQKLGDIGQGLEQFRTKVEALLAEWEAGIDISYRRTVRIEGIKKSAGGGRRPNTKLRVRFANGPEFEEHKAADTFALAVQEFGLDRVERLNLNENGAPLITSTPHPNYYHRQLGNRFLSTHSSTERKKKLLEQMAKALQRKISVTIIHP